MCCVKELEDFGFPLLWRAVYVKEYAAFSFSLLFLCNEFYYCVLYVGVRNAIVPNGGDGPVN